MADRTVTYSFVGNFSSLTAGLTAAGRSTAEFGGKLTALDAQGAKMRAGLTTLGSTAGKFGLAAAAGLGVAAKASMDFEGSFARMEGLVGVASGQLEEWKGQVRELGPEYGATATKAADALFFITSAGLEGTDAMDALEASLKASAVGLGEVSTIADLATSAMNAYGSDTLSAAGATDVLTAAVREGKLAPDQLAGAMGRVLPIASAMGVSFDQVGAAMAAMSRTGTNASEAATQLRGILTSILSPAQQAHAGFEAVGLSAEGLQASLREDGLHATLLTIMDAFDGNATATEAVFGNVRALSGVMDLMGSNADATADIFNELENSTGSLDTAFDVMSDTAGFKAKQALAEMQGALIDIGDAALPVVSAGLSGFASGLSAIPGPAKQATAGLLGVTAVLGSGLWFTSKVVNGIAGANTALSNLGVSANISARSLGKFLGVAGGLTAAVLAARALGDALDDAFDTRVDESTLMRDLEALSRGEVTSGLGMVASDLQRLTQTAAGLGEPLEEVHSLFGLLGDTSGDKASANIERVDNALASMVEAGQADQAAAVFREIVKLAEEGGVSASQAADQFEQYSTAIANTVPQNERLLSVLRGFDGLIGRDPMREVIAGLRETKEAGSGLDGLLRGVAGGFDAAGGAAGDAAGEVMSLSDALAGLSGWLDKREALRGYGDAMRDLSKSIKDGFSREDAENVDNVGRSIVQVADTLKGGARFKFIDDAIAGLQEMAQGAGPKAKAAIRELIGELQKAADTKVGPEIDLDDGKFKAKEKHAQGLLRGLDDGEAVPEAGLDIRDFQKALGLTEADLRHLDQDKATPGVQLDDNASGPIASIRANLQSLNGFVARVGIHTVRTYSGAGRDQAGGPQVASGGHITGPGTATSDSIPAWLSDGEYVVRAAAVDRYGVDFLHRINAMKFAAGGLATHATAEGYANGGRARFSPGLDRVGLAADVAARGLRGLNQRLKESEKALAKEKKQRDAVVSRQDAIRSGVSNAFLSDPFASLGSNVWSPGGGGNLIGSLQGDIAGLREYDALIKKLGGKRRGQLDGVALEAVAASGNLQGLQALAAMSRADRERWERLFERRASLAQGVGNRAANEALGKELRVQTKELRQAQQELRRIKAAIKDEGKKDRGNRDRNTDRQVKGQSRGAANARRRAKV